MELKKYKFNDIVIGNEGLLKGPFGSDLKKELYVPKSESTYKVYLQENILKKDNFVGNHYITKDYYDTAMKRYAVKEGDFIVTCDGTLGEIFQLKNITEKGIISSSLLRITLNKELCDEVFFPYFWTIKMKKTLVARANNSVLKHLPGLTDIRNFSFELPNLPTQRKIAAVLSALDNKIDLNRSINRNLEALAKQHYDYWFVQFDFPFDFAQGKPNAEGKPYKSSGGKMVWNDKLKREVPEGWEVKKLEDTLKCDISGDWGEEQTKGNHTYKVNCIRGCDMVNMTNLPERYIIPKNADKLLETNDFVIEISGGSPSQSTGRIVQITEEIINRFNKKVICSNFCHGIRLKEANLVSYFLQTWNTFYKNGVFFNYEGKTSGLKNFQFDSFFSNYWYFPPMELARQYHETYSKIKEKIDKTETEITKLTALRDKLLPLLMNGQVEVKG